MYIRSSEIQLAAQHEAERKHSIELSAGGRFRQILGEQVQLQEAEPGPRERLARMFEQLLEAVLAALEGRKCRSPGRDCRLPEQSRANSPPGLPSWSTQGREIIAESEQLQVCGSGQVKTADGRCITFDLEMSLARSERIERAWDQDSRVVLQDPLVLNFAGKAAELSGERISFDLNSDGEQESLPGLACGSGYLVLDRNGNGRADCGNELFGAKSGDGFGDLAAFDSDGNGWIDEADPVFDQLSIWRGGTASDTLTGLANAGVGALWLGQVNSPFSFKDAGGNLLGQLRATGLWLSEAGQAHTMQQVDLAVSPVSRETADSVPQPRGPANAGGITVAGGQQAGDDVVRENVPGPQSGHVDVEPVEVGEAAAEDNGRWVKNIDHVRQGTG